MNDRRVDLLVTGGSGMVGSQVHSGRKPSRAELDVTDSARVERTLRRYRPCAVLHLAAIVDMARCEAHPDEAYRVNVLGTYNLALSCRALGIPLVCLSSCAVFDGVKKTPYRENDIPHPLNVYGSTKLIGEQIVRELVPEHLIIRTGWLFGGTADKKFVRKCLEAFRQGNSVRATNDRFGSPTYVPDLVRAIMQLVSKRGRGTYHVVNSGRASYFDMARALKTIGGFSPTVTPVSCLDVEAHGLKRGKNEVLASRRMRLRPWQAALRAYARASGE